MQNILLLVGFVAIVYFMMIRPQKKKEKEDKAMRESLSVGDEILTIGGVVGKVTKITEKTVVISTGAANNKIEFVKSAIAQVTSGKGAAASSKKAEKKADAETEEKAPNREKKVSPKKIGKKADNEESSESAESTETEDK